MSDHSLNLITTEKQQHEDFSNETSDGYDKHNMLRENKITE